MIFSLPRTGSEIEHGLRRFLVLLHLLTRYYVSLNVKLDIFHPPVELKILDNLSALVVYLNTSLREVVKLSVSCIKTRSKSHTIIVNFTTEPNCNQQVFPHRIFVSIHWDIHAISTYVTLR